MKKMKIISLAITLLLCLGGIFGWFFLREPEELKVSSVVEEITKQAKENKQEIELEEPIVEEQVKEKEAEPVLQEEDKLSTVTVESTELLSVPFIVQAPHAEWTERYEETCEEASVLMVHEYYKNTKELSQDQMKALLDPLTDWGDIEFNGLFDTSISETAKYFTDYLGYDVSRIQILENPTADDIKALLAAGLPVIMPAAGRELGNKFFQTPGPLYHMLVITGYNRDDFITNDPGTRRGEGYRYNQEILMNAIHDWTGDKETILEGDKRVLVITPSS